MKNFVLLTMLLFVGFTACQRNEEVIKEKVEKEVVKTHKDGLFVHISTNEARKVLMGLSIANKMLPSSDVIVFIDAEAINVTIKDGEVYQMDGYEASSVELMQKLTKAGVKIMVCPMCLKSFGKTEADLLEGLEIAKGENFFGFTKGRIMTLDY
ncbi:MAG: peroxiredoxin [Salinivirgaceae bacterium]|nr:MAG: peroxiredoxin [Salinivirgaceae bacterium]